MVTIESAQLSFDRWRSSKASSSAHIPEKLWDMVRQLLLTHKRAEICKALGVNSNQIKSHCATSSITKNQMPQPSQAIGDFVEATLPTNVGMAELTLKGQSKSLHLSLPTSTLREVLPILGALL